MSAHPVRGWIYMLVPMIGLGLGAAPAHAEKKVDWTPYLEQPGERTKVRATPKTVQVAAPAKKVTRSQAAKQRPTAVTQTKAKRKAPAKRR